MCLIKTLLVKPSEKKPSEGKEYNILYVSTASLKKPCRENAMGQKSGRREKEYSTLTLGHSGLPLMSTSFGWRITILYLSFLNVKVGNALVSKSARLSLERIC